MASGIHPESRVARLPRTAGRLVQLRSSAAAACLSRLLLSADASWVGGAELGANRVGRR